MFVRSSKYRHVFGCPARKELCYEGVKVTKNAHDSNFCAVNPKFVAVVVESGGGGVFLALPIDRTGRIEATYPKVCGHRGPITDLRWDPFDDNVIASSSEDATIKLWRIPDEGLTEDLADCEAVLQGHTKKVTLMEWHPTAACVLLSASVDLQCIVWRTDTATALRVIGAHRDTVHSLGWSKDGALFVTSCKDKLLRVIDPRTGAVLLEGEGHQGNKSSKVVFLADKQKLFTTGFSRASERECAVWDISGATIRCLHTETIDASNGVLMPFYDPDTSVVYLAGKGDGNIRYYELVDTPPYAHYLSQYQSSAPQRGLGMMPKRGVDASRCEVARFYKLHTLKDICEPIAMIVPRKSETFQADIFPPTASDVAAMTVEQWWGGTNHDPVLVSMKDGSISNAPSGVSAQPKPRAKVVRNEVRRSETVTVSSSQVRQAMNGESSLAGPTACPDTIRPPTAGSSKIYRAQTMPPEPTSQAPCAPLAPRGALRRLRRRRAPAEEEGESSSCSSTEGGAGEGEEAGWSENPLYSQGAAGGGGRRKGGSGAPRSGQHRSLLGLDKVDTGPLDDVLLNVQSGAVARQTSRSSHDLHQRNHESHDPIRSTGVNSAIVRLDGSKFNELSSGEENAPGGGGTQGGGGRMIDCISVEAPDDVLITPSVLRESMRCKGRRQSSVDGVAAGVTRAGSMRAGHAPPLGAGAGGGAGRPPRVTRGLARTGSLRETDMTRPHYSTEQGEAKMAAKMVDKMADNAWIKVDQTSDSSEAVVSGTQSHQPMPAQQQEPMGAQGKAGSGGVSGGQQQKASNQKYVFTVPTGDTKNGAWGEGGASGKVVDRSNKVVAENGAKHGLKHDYRELLSRYFLQQEEIKQLKEQLSTKDNLIRRLEDQLKLAQTS